MQGARIKNTKHTEWSLAPAVNNGIADILEGTKTHHAYRLSSGWDERIGIINEFYGHAQQKDTYAVEVHFNSSNQPARMGYFVMAWHMSDLGKRLARSILKEIHKCDAGTKNLGVNLSDGKNLWVGRPWEYESHRGSFVKVTDCPAVLIEAGFLTNHIDASLIQQEHYRVSFGWAIGRGIVNFLTEVDSNDPFNYLSSRNTRPGG
jgi:hypothetical protein